MRLILASELSVKLKKKKNYKINLMSCYLSTSCFKNYELTKAIRCGKLSDKNYRNFAPHPYQPIEDIKNILSNFKEL